MNDQTTIQPTRFRTSVKQVVDFAKEKKYRVEIDERNTKMRGKTIWLITTYTEKDRESMYRILERYERFE